ncbi:hypothetical protein DL762_002768 [Monosporascus cannonballus]|uniref:Heterokaryon incompatibility domain-containing protein n=1 Tax=Monosporascus cannonballus TaxID=155416 RepID=A0ABY0HGV7_9PEZI|nr:hypothetical protein DL762_002768 [Monosporascus cannonballus]
MEYITTKTLLPSKAVELVKFEEFVKEFSKDFDKNSDKLRALLNLLFIPRFKPTFNPIPIPQTDSPNDSALVSTPAAKPVRYPIRMFDIATGNLVERPSIGVTGEYCIVSHSWKGSEIEYSFITDMKSSDIQRIKELAARASIVEGRTTAVGYSEDQRSDVQKIKDKCRVEIDEQEMFIRFLASNVSGEMPKSDASGDIVRGLLASRLGVKSVEDAVKGDQDAKAERHINVTNANDFESLAREMEGKALSAKGQVNQAANAESRDDEQSPSMDGAEKAQPSREASQEDFKFFQENSHLRAAVDEMLSCLERWRSAIKIEQSIECAKKVFDEKFFPTCERRYLWLDSCCIDKRNYSEEVESFSLMGDWYAHAEFCLVHLDESNEPEEWIREWDILRKDRSRKPNYTSFGDIDKEKPRWATRGWTLQELILSKNTFYVNSAWGPLSRPVENLGPYYYICPFIELYCYTDERVPQEVDELQGFWELDVLKDIMKRGNANLRDRNENSLFTSNNADEDASRIEVAQKLIIILEDLGVQMPKDIDRETATSRIAEAVYSATKRLSEEQDNGNRVNKTLFNIFKGYLREYAPEKYFPNGGNAKETIDFLLKCLVAEARDPVLRDREYIAKFSNVNNLSSWQEGTVRSKFPAETVMSLATKREVTFGPDAAYSLMGLFDVRYPTFKPDELPKALSRLMDEIVISSNDVSVFNWTGTEWASPIRGRSLHPSSLKAFKLPDNANKERAELVQIRMHEVMAAYENTFTMLRDAINFVKKKEQRNVPIEWIQGVIRFVKKAQFAALQQQQRSIGKILVYIQKNCGDVPAPPKSQDKKSEKSGTESGESGSLPFGMRPPLSMTPSLLKGKMSLPMFPGKSSESEASSKKGMGFSKPSFGKFGKRDSESSKSPPAETGAPTPLSPTMSTAETVVDEPRDPSLPEPQLTKAIWKPLHSRVMGFIKSITPQDAHNSDDEDEEDEKSPETPAAEALPTESNATLPPEVQEVVVDISETKYAKRVTGTNGMGSTISPNPIIVNNSGIEGIFDIQRVIIRMLEPEKLRAAIRKAASRHQKITGTCTISTGFAMVTVKFTCEKHTLEKQLDVVETVERKVVEMQRRDPEEEVDAELWKGITATHLTLPLGDKKESAEPSKKEQEGRDALDDVDDKDQTKEEKMVSRMIKFIETPDLEYVAGEWVLARFSNTPGAKWFLCHFELGATHEFYGYRIAADEINFHDASPEPGLLSVWNTYMARKKRKLCKILETYIDSQDWANSGVEVRKEGMKVGTEMLKEGTGLAKRALSSLSDDPGKDSEGLDFERVMDQILEHGKTAAKLAGHFTVLAVGEKLLEMHAERLEKNLSASVIKRTPKRLRGAVESLNDNKDLLPAMFHSSKRVHMF